MSTMRNRWYALSLALLTLGAAVLMFTLRPNRAVSGSAAAATDAPSTAPGSTGPTIRPPSAGPSQRSGPSGTASGTGAAEPPPDVEPDGVIGAATGGDPYYPDAGNGGYDASAYQVDLTFEPERRELTAATTITATVTATEKLGRLFFDLQPTMKVVEVTVDGTAAGFSQRDAKLAVTPVVGLAPGAETSVSVRYAGTPGQIAGGTAGLADGGWYTLKSGGAVVIGEPFSASAWYPVNEVPTDRATFQVTAAVPSGWEVISNGLPVTDGLPTPPDGYELFRWAENSEMASYLSTIYIDTFVQTRDSTGSGLPVINAYAEGQEAARELGDRTGEFVNFLASKFGPYPFESTGGIYLGESFGFSLETQTRPVYSAGMADEATLVHELAHQWFGDDVTIARWADICLNECFATYASWLWAENRGADLDARYRQAIASTADQPSFWSSPLYDMGVGKEFAAVYSRGPLALHALRHELGDEKFDELLLSWIEEHSGRSASWADFESMVNTIAGADKAPFLHAWFRSTTTPEDRYLYPGDLTP